MKGSEIPIEWRQRREAVRQREKNGSRGERKKAVGEEPYKHVLGWTKLNNYFHVSTC